MELKHWIITGIIGIVAVMFIVLLISTATSSTEFLCAWDTFTNALFFKEGTTNGLLAWLLVVVVFKSLHVTNRIERR